jgi:hypothetical protein
MNFYSNERRLGNNEVNEEDLKAMCFYLKRLEVTNILFSHEYARKITTEIKLVPWFSNFSGDGATAQGKPRPDTDPLLLFIRQSIFSFSFSLANATMHKGLSH